jgi:hypothetical protein
MLTDDEILNELRIRFDNVAGPEFTHDGRKFFRVDGLPMMIEQARTVVGDVGESGS